MKNSIYKAEAIDIRNIDHAAIENDIAIIFRDVYIFDGTLEENLRVVNPQATHWELLAAAEAACLHKAISRMPDGWGTFLGRKGVQLSDEQQRQIAVARAFLKNARIVLIDETGFNPDDNEWDIRQTIINLSKDPNRIVLVTGHIFTGKDIFIRSGNNEEELELTHQNNKLSLKEKDKQIAIETMEGIIEKIKMY